MNITAKATNSGPGSLPDVLPGISPRGTFGETESENSAVSSQYAKRVRDSLTHCKGGHLIDFVFAVCNMRRRRWLPSEMPVKRMDSERFLSQWVFFR